MVKKAFNREAVDSVKSAIGAVIDPVLSEKQKNAVQPEGEGGLRRRHARVKKLPAKRKRTVLL